MNNRKPFSVKLWYWGESYERSQSMGPITVFIICLQCSFIHKQTILFMLILSGPFHNVLVLCLFYPTVVDDKCISNELAIHYYANSITQYQSYDKCWPSFPTSWTRVLGYYSFLLSNTSLLSAQLHLRRLACNSTQILSVQFHIALV